MKHLFHVLTRPLDRNFYTDFKKLIAKYSIQYEKGMNFLIELLLEMTKQSFYNYMGKAVLSLNRYRKSTDPSDVRQIQVY